MKWFVIVISLIGLLHFANAARNCSTQRDILLLVEDSEVLLETEVPAFKTFLADVAHRFNIRLDTVRFAFELYNSSVPSESSVIFDFKKFDQMAGAVSAIEQTVFHRTAGGYASISQALSFTLNNVLTVAKGERSCFPTIVILVSYSSFNDPNHVRSNVQLNRARDPEVLANIHQARLFQNLGGQLIAVGIGPERNPGHLRELSKGYYFDVQDFESFTEEIIQGIVDAACNYEPNTTFYPQVMEEVVADFVFCVDITEKMNETFQDAVVQFIKNFLTPYTFNRDFVQAALVTYSKTFFPAIHLNDFMTLDQFVKKTRDVIAEEPKSNVSNIRAGLDGVNHHALVPDAGFRNGSSAVYVIAASCFSSDEDPSIEAAEVRDKTNDQLYVVALDPKFWKEYSDIAGSSFNVYDFTNNPVANLVDYFPGAAWKNVARNYAPPPPPATTTGALTTTTAGETTTTAPTTTGPKTHEDDPAYLNSKNHPKMRK